MADSEHFKPRACITVEDEVILKAVNSPGPYVGQVFSTKFSGPTLERMKTQTCNSGVDGVKKCQSRFGIGLMDFVEVSVSVKFSLMPDKDLDPIHAASSFLLFAARLVK